MKASYDESPAAVGSSTASAATIAGSYGRAPGKRSSKRENALQAQLTDLSDRLNLNLAEAELEWT